MIMLGLWGAWRILKGTFMVVAPKAQQGDVSSQQRIIGKCSGVNHSVGCSSANPGDADEVV